MRNESAWLVSEVIARSRAGKGKPGDPVGKPPRNRAADRAETRDGDSGVSHDSPPQSVLGS